MIETIVSRCIRAPWLVIALAVLVAAASLFYVIGHFAITTDTQKLISSDLPYRQDEIAFAKAFPETQDLIVAVIDGQTPEAAGNAAGRLASGLSERTDLFRSVRQPQDSAFFARNGLLLLPVDRVEALTQEIAAAAPLLGALDRDPTLFGLSQALSELIGGRMSGSRSAADAPASGAASAGSSDPRQVLGAAGPLFSQLAGTIGSALDGDPDPMSWQRLFEAGGSGGKAASGNDTRRIVLAQPVLDYSALEPGAEAIGALRQIAAGAGLTAENGIELRLTGPVPLADEEFATVAENQLLNGSLTLLAIAVLLFLALRSGRLILSVLATLFTGLVVTFAIGLFLVGELNLISVAFAVLFIGLGVDFGIQLSIRYRTERFAIGRKAADGLAVSIRAAARAVGLSLTLAAASLLAGFFSFLPTEFRGVSELGLIAGIGMIVAYVASLTLLPALMTVMRLPAERSAIEAASLAKVDHFIARNRVLVIAATAAATLAGLPYLLTLSFDSNPMNLRSQTVESVATFLDLTKNPQTAPNKLEVLVDSRHAIAPMAKRLADLPEVDHTVSIDSFVPEDQAPKLAAIAAARRAMEPVFGTPANAEVGPGPQETAVALTRASRILAAASGRIGAPLGPAMQDLAGALDRLSEASPDLRDEAEQAIFANFPQLIQSLRASLSATPITRGDLPADLVSDWQSADGTYRIEVSPSGDSNDNAVLQAFADAVRTVAPHASGPPIGITEAGAVITRAFLQAGLFALLAITAILWIALRRLYDVVMALGPLVLAGIWTLEFSSAIGLPLNFANIIALPLMFGVGVAFHIYYLVAWRAGIADVLASSLTRAIFFSALTTGTAFGSLWASSHPGTASMGELLAISLVFTLIAAFFVVPAFLGPPPRVPESAGKGGASQV